MKQKATTIRGTVATESTGCNGLCTRGFVDSEHKVPLGEAAVAADGSFEIAVGEATRVWFGWDPEPGRSPRLQPFDVRFPVRLNVYQARRVANIGDSGIRLTVSSSSGSHDSDIREAAARARSQLTPTQRQVESTI